MAKSTARWLVVCSCGWTRECLSAWAARSASKVHQKIGAAGVKHTMRIKAPNSAPGSQLPLV